MARIVVVGAGGFIGQALVARLADYGVPTLAVTRRPTGISAGLPSVAIGDLSAGTDWTQALRGAASVVHLASRAHQPAGSAQAIETEVAAGAHLAASAARAGLRQVVLLSSAKAHGESTQAAPFRAEQPLAPISPYGVAKARLEAAMTGALRGSDTSLAIIRPPLVYGAGVPANFLALLHLVHRALALPFASIRNRRSFLYRENLVDLLVRILRRPNPVHGAFLARDGEDLSTPALVRRIGGELGRTPLLLPCPVWALRLGAALVGQAEGMARLSDSLQLDDMPTRMELSWEPPFGFGQGLAATCRWFEKAALAR